MPLISDEDYVHFEKKLYLPMLIKILEQDLELIRSLPFKLNRPYLIIVENALNYIRKDLKASEFFLTKHDMRLIRGETEDNCTEYILISRGHEERKKYTSIQLREKTEEMMYTYLSI